MIINADAVAWAKDYQGELFHALFSDTPYNLGKGFMNQTWDTDVAFQPETWVAFKRILYPGAMGMAFGGSRTYHRMAVAIEDAGFIIHPNIFGWAYGSGFTAPQRVDTLLNLPDSSWGQYRYGLGSYRPALEPIVVFQKPFEGRPIDCVAQTGAGAVHFEKRTQDGRLPTNFYIVHHSDCTPDGCYETCPVLNLGNQSGQTKAGGNVRPDTGTGIKTNLVYGQYRHNNHFDSFSDEGTAARYFAIFGWQYEQAERLDLADDVFYCPKPLSAEKDLGLADEETVLRHRVNGGGMEADQKWGPVEAKNPHPTVKPIDCTRYFTGLLLPPALVGQRRLFVPFAGTGSEVIGGCLSGWDVVTGIELQADYTVWGQKREAYWRRNKQEIALFDSVREFVKAEAKAAGQQPSLFATI